MPSCQNPIMSRSAAKNASVLAREWEEGYRRMPESRAEIEAAEAAGKLAFDPRDDW